MKFVILVILILVSVNLAMAADKANVYDLVCKVMVFDSDKTECLSKLSRFSYFDDRALSICAALSFDSNKNECLETIGNKSYEIYEMNICLNEVFESYKLQCLKDKGIVYSSNTVCVSTDEMILKLNSSLLDLQNGHINDLKSKLENLMKKFKACKHE